jgi:hypothetical protein
MQKEEAILAAFGSSVSYYALSYQEVQNFIVAFGLGFREASV